MNLKRRIERIEGEIKPAAPRAVIQGFLADSALLEGTFAPTALDSDDPRLQQGVDEDGEAVISRWWSVWFFEGSKEQQEERLKELSLDPQFQKPWVQNEIPIRFEGGARCEDVFLRLQENEQNEKLKPASTS